jgi:streptogramin lyase
VVGTVAIGDTLNGGGVAAFGAVWVSDSGRGEIVKVDPDSRRVIARIPVAGETEMAAARGSLWAVRNASGTPSGPLLRIDPRTGRVVERIALRTPAGDAFFGAVPIAAGSRIWVGGPNGVLAVDPARNRVVGHIALSGGYNLQDALIHDGELWLTSASGATDRYDARTGRRLGRLRWETGAGLIPYGDRFIQIGRDAVALVDETGRASWRTRIAQDLHIGEVLGNRVLVAGLDGVSPRERMWELDARTGRLSRPLTLPEFSPRRILAVNGETWVLTGGGRAVVIDG